LVVTKKADTSVRSF